MKMMVGRSAAKKVSLFSPRSLGYSIIELIIVVSILFLVMAAVVLGFTSYATKQAFNEFVNDVEFSIKEQRHKTLASVDNKQYGVYVGTTTIVYFEGPTYTSGASGNEVITVPNGITATSSFGGGSWFVSFNRLTGAASASGTIAIFDTRTQSTSTITISNTGLVE